MHCAHKSFKTGLSHGLVLQKVHRLIRFNQEAWLKPYIDMNTKLRTAAKNYLKKDFLKLMNNAVFGKTTENVRKHRDIKLIKAEKRRNQLASEPNYHRTKYFSNNLMATDKLIYLGRSILHISKTLMYDYIKPK